MPGKVALVQQVHPPRGPERRGDMPLLMGKFIKRDAQRPGQNGRLAAARQKTRHVRPLHRPGARADANGGDIARVQMRK